MAFSGVWTFSGWDGVLRRGEFLTGEWRGGVCVPRGPSGLIAMWSMGVRCCSCSGEAAGVVAMQWGLAAMAQRKHVKEMGRRGMTSYLNLETGAEGIQDDPLASRLVTWVDGGACHQQGLTSLRFCASVTWEKCTPCSVLVYVLVFIQMLSLFSLHSRDCGSHRWVVCPSHVNRHGGPGPPTHCVRGLAPSPITLCQRLFSTKRLWAEKVWCAGLWCPLSPLPWWTQ